MNSLFAAYLFLILLIGLVAVSIVYLFVYAVMPYLPMIFDYSGYMVWRKCYKNDDFYLYCRHNDHVMVCERYRSTTLPYEVVVFKTKHEVDSAIFEKSGKILFGSYYAKHSKKMCEKLKNVN